MHDIKYYTVKNLVKPVAVNECHWKFLYSKIYSDGHYLPQISLPFHQVFLHCMLHINMILVEYYSQIAQLQ